MYGTIKHVYIRFNDIYCKIDRDVYISIILKTESECSINSFEKQFGFQENTFNDEISNYCFIHSCCLENGKTERLDYLINYLIDSNCINVLKKIFIINIGHNINSIYIDQFNHKNKLEILNYSSNVTLNESPTINEMILFSKNNPKCNILYIHTKGVRYNINDTKELDWINLMLYFLLNKHSHCLNMLNESYDSVGCNYHDGSNGIKKHYSGNFWWAKSNHLAKLDYIEENNHTLLTRQLVEFHLCSIDHKYGILHNSNINHYHENYPPEKYIDSLK